MPWPRKQTIDALKLKQENRGLQLQLVRLGEQLRNKRNYAAGLEIPLRERLTRIDELSAKIDQQREQNRRLDEEAEWLATIIGGPPVNASSLAPSDPR